MPKTTPFLTGLSTLLCGRPKRKRQEVLAAQRSALLEQGPGISQQLRDEISPELLKEHSVTKRVRDYPQRTIWNIKIALEPSRDMSRIISLFPVASLVLP